MAIAEQAAAQPESSSAASRIEVRTAESPEASHRASQFGPLPLVLRPDPPTGRKVTRERRGSRSNRVRAIILCWWPGMPRRRLGMVSYKRACPAKAEPTGSRAAAAATAGQAAASHDADNDRAGALSHPLDASDP